MDELNHSAGKGDKERSPGWRRNYDEIDFHRSTRDGFARRGNRLVKAYGGRMARFTFPETPPALGILDYEGIHPGDADFLPMEKPSDCLAKSPMEFSCTRSKGHAGDHAAHGMEDMYARWPQTPADLSRYMLDNKIKL